MTSKWFCFEEAFIYAFMCYFIYYFFQGTDTLSRKKTVLDIVESIESMRHTLSAIQCNFSIFGKGRHVDHAHSRSEHCK